MKNFWLALILTATTVVSAQTPEQKILTYKQYASILHKSPYILQFNLGSGALLFYGAEHTGDPKNPQIADIERRWKEYHPTMAYNEGGDPPTLDDAEAAVRQYAEPGFLRFLAGRDHVPVATFEPSFRRRSHFRLEDVFGAAGQGFLRPATGQRIARCDGFDFTRRSNQRLAFWLSA